MFSVSTDEEVYHGQYESIEEAIEDSAKHHEVFFVGECVRPDPPENFWYASDWLEHVSCQDEYAGDYADNWDGSSKEQIEELEAEVRDVMAKWLDRHDLRPKFWLVTDAVRYVVVDGKPVLASELLQ